MQSMIDKSHSRAIRLQIRGILLDISDPIGIKDEPNAQNEYDGYIGSIYDLLVSKASDDSLIDYLHWAVHDSMGLDAASKVDMLETVSALQKN